MSSYIQMEAELGLMVERRSTQVAYPRRKEDKRPYAVILAGGEGSRLRPLTRILAGDDRPKQFCAVTGGETLLHQTTRRIGALVHPKRTIVVVTRGQERFLQPGMVNPGTSVIVQPANRGTAPAILYSLFSLRSEDPETPLALFPADHYFTKGAVFMNKVAEALQVVRSRPKMTVLLGVVPTGPEPDYGWIQAGSVVPGVLHGTLFHVDGFVEKPDCAVAQDLFAARCLWNSFVVVSSVYAVRCLVQSALPQLFEAFQDASAQIGGPQDADMIEELYSRISPGDFSKEVLSACPESLAVLPVAGSGWVDVGRPDRVYGLFAHGRTQSELSRAPEELES